MPLETAVAPRSGRSKIAYQRPDSRLLAGNSQFGPGSFAALRQRVFLTDAGYRLDFMHCAATDNSGWLGAIADEHYYACFQIVSR